MTQLYARVFTQILDSSLAEDWQVRHVFEDLLKLANDGVVDMTRQAISRRTNVPLEVVNAAIAVLEAPDPESRDAAEEGRRLVRLDEHRDWGWRIVNWDKYEAVRSTVDQRVKTRERVQRHRQKLRQGTLPPVPPSQKRDSFSLASEAEAPLPKRYTPLQGVTQSARNGEKGAKESRPASTLSDSEWLASLKSDSAYQGIDVDREHGKMVRWCQTNGKQPTRRRFVNWLNRCDRRIEIVNHSIRPDHSKGF